MTIRKGSFKWLPLADCHTTMTIRKDSFLDKLKLPLLKWLLLMHRCVRQYPMKDTVDEISAMGGGGG